MAENCCLRKRLLVDVPIQGALVVRVVLYWLMCLFIIGALLLSWRWFASPPGPLGRDLRELWSQYGMAAVASAVLLPLVVFDLLRLSHRFAGPMFRLRRSMRDLARGKPVAAIRFREGDFWHEFADDFNAVAARLGELERRDALGEYGEKENVSVSV